MSEIIDLAGRMKGGDPNIPGEGTTEPPPVFGFGTPEGGLASMDVDAFFNMRDWLQAACEGCTDDRRRHLFSREFAPAAGSL
jgi:hypothetical protein